jgi:sulfofructose kinase
MSTLPKGWTGPNPSVICLGLSAYDHIWTLDTIPDNIGKSRANHFESTGGGMAATASVAVARLGGRSHFWGRAGQDAAGIAMRGELERSGVDVSAFQLFEDAQSSVSGVLVDGSGERMIVNFRGGNLPADPGWLPLNALKSADCVLADPRWPEAAVHVFGEARKLGIPTVLDADVATPDVFEALLPLTDHAIFSEQALASFAGTDAPLEKIAGFGCAVAAVTRGADGVDWLENGQSRHVAAFKVPVVDTNGAGDVFHGAWAFAIGAGADTISAAGFASAAAALKCTRSTGRRGIPDFKETLNLWRPTI